MYALDGTFPIVFLAVSCGLTLAAAAEFALLACFKRRGAGTVVLAVFTGLVWLAVTLMPVAYLLVRFGVVGLKGGALDFGGFTLPYIGRALEMFDYWVTHVFAAVIIVLSLGSFVLCCVRRRVKTELPSFVRVLETERQAAEAAASAQAPQTVGSRAVGDVSPAIIAEEAAPAVAAEEVAPEIAGVEVAPELAADVIPVAADPVSGADTIYTAGVTERDTHSADTGQARPAAYTDEGHVENGSGRVGDTAERAFEPRFRAAAAERLPAGRRHILLNRSNVVEMFGEYLAGKNEAEKKRLENAINTIILK